MDNRPSEKELEAFRKNLKKSVIMSFSSKAINEGRQSTIINVKKSRI
jgi:tRNA A37 threonylcarbamoyladenosine synthetase subunit TsaC/SUA5/YrdC